MPISKISSKNKLYLKEIQSLLAPFTKRAYFVGGCVRDMLLNKPLQDFDIEIYDIQPELFDELMQKLGAKGVGKSFFVYKFHNFDLALARSENKVAQGHRGFEVRICNDAKEAAKRRDFTINSMMINIFDNEFLDFYGGKKDLEQKILRHIDDESFVEDSLRVLRGVDFVARFDLKIAEKTLNLMQTMDISDLSKERINAQLYKFFKASNLVRGFEALQELGLEKKLFGFDTKAHTNLQKFKQRLELSRPFVDDEGFFLYVYVNFFAQNKKKFLQSLNLKKELVTKALQDFCENEINEFELGKIALIMPLKSWLGLWDAKRIAQAKKLEIYEKKLSFHINLKECENKEGKALGECIKRLKFKHLKLYIKEKNNA